MTLRAATGGGCCCCCCPCLTDVYLSLSANTRDAAAARRTTPACHHHHFILTISLTDLISRSDLLIFGCGSPLLRVIMSSTSPRSTSSKRKTLPNLSDSDGEGVFCEVLTRQARRKQKKVNKHRPEFQFNIQELKYGKKVTLAVSLARVNYS